MAPTDRPSHNARSSTASTWARPAAAMPSEASAAWSNGVATSSPTTGRSPTAPPASRSRSERALADSSVCRPGPASSIVVSWTPTPTQIQPTIQATKSRSATI